MEEEVEVVENGGGGREREVAENGMGEFSGKGKVRRRLRPERESVAWSEESHQQ
jgi:hypothetical protein